MDSDDPLPIVADEMEKQRRLFILGLIILFGWMTVIVLCAYPQLFRDLFLHYVCCCFAGFAARRRHRLEKLNRAQERVRSASRSFLSVSVAMNPSAILLKQIGLGGNLVELGLRRQQMKLTRLSIPEAIAESEFESNCPSRSEELANEEKLLERRSSTMMAMDVA